MPTLYRSGTVVYCRGSLSLGVVSSLPGRDCNLCWFGIAGRPGDAINAAYFQLGGKLQSSPHTQVLPA